MMNKEDKLKLIDELLGKSRNINDELYSKSIDFLNEKENELTDILIQNQKDLKELTKDHLGLDEEKIESLKAKIAEDFNINFDEKEVNLVRGSLSKLPFEEIEKKVKERIYGQDDAIRKILIGFRRPYITGFNPLGIRNTILLTGPNGSGRHSLLKEVVKELKNQNLEKSDEIYFIDMKRYQSQAQESIFLQDLYASLMGNGSVVVFENFEQAYAPYNRMLTELVLNGKFTLNKRYNLSSNALLETSSKLTSQAVDSLNGNNKYLVFLTSNKESKVLDVFGKAFVDKILDKVNTQILDDESVKRILNNILNDLKVKFKNQLEIEVEINPNIADYFLNYYEPQDGIDSIMPVVDKFYNVVIDLALNKQQLKNLKFYCEDKNLYYEQEEQKQLLQIENDQNKERENIQKELDDIVGLKEVKDYLKSLEDHIKISKIRKQKGLKTAEISKHMIFKGNPGTGKTTIARLISRMMKACGILSQGQLVEVSRADLVGKYVGHTAPLTMSVIESALGGVLFIDEAYSLYRGKDDSFGLEAIDTIVKAMEDYRDDLIVILAGYTREMEEFLTANSGLKSRFANIIVFEDYTGQELLDIAKIIAKHKDYKIDEQACSKLLDYFTMMQAKNDERSGNGRLARNVVEEAILKQANRILKDEKAEIDLLKLEDFDLKN